MKKYDSRVMVSFDGKCPMGCKHCYTYDLEKKECNRDINELVQEIEEKIFDIIYISQSYENFFDEIRGLRLCHMLYEKYQKDMFIITRSFLSNKVIDKLGKLNQVMKSEGHQLFIAVSVCAEQSYGFTEQKGVCPTPQQRLLNLERVHNVDIKTILLVRPVFPDSIIPVYECKILIERSKSYINAVVSSGLIVTNKIIERLGLRDNGLLYQSDGDSEYLADLEPGKAKYVDVDNELNEIQDFCISNSIQFFKHSIPALNYLATL